jgi:hypothetical protein
LVEQLDLEPDVILLPHSTLRGPLDRPYRAVRMIRDPRDVWVSGYLYHMRCDEEWCRNIDMDPTPPIQWPQVDYSFAHWPEDWKRTYLERLGGKSYQQNLIDRSVADGLDFELNGYTGCTLATMREWKLNGADALDVKLEDIMADFDGTMLRVFSHFGFTAEQSQAALEMARLEDIRRMDHAAITERPQIYSRTISKWRDVLSAAQIARFEERHGDLIRELGYELAGAVPSPSKNGDASAGLTQAPTPLAARADEAKPMWSRPAPRRKGCDDTPRVVTTTQDPDIWLSADGAAIRPVATDHGIYYFVVPSGRAEVRLESRCGIMTDPRTPYGSTARRLGVRVSRIAIRSDAGEIVIVGDDPSLTTGWHDAEQAGAELWRWTDGSAALPWAGVSGPAVVAIRCVALAEYPIYGGEQNREQPGDRGSGCSQISWLLGSHDGGAV